MRGARGQVIFTDCDDACDDRDDLCDVLAKVRRRGWTPDPINDVLDGHYDGIGLGFEIGLGAKGGGLTVRKAFR